MSTTPVDDNTTKKLSKKEQNKLERKLKKQAISEAKKANSSNNNSDEIDYSQFSHLFGNLPCAEKSVKNESERRLYTLIQDVNEDKVGQTLLVRGRIQSKRPASSKLLFIILRQRWCTVQATACVDEDTPRELIRWISKLGNESIVDVYGIVSEVPEKIEACSQQSVEIKVKKIFLVSPAGRLPMLIQDVSIPEPLLQAQREKIEGFHRQVEVLNEKLKITASSQEKDEIEKQLSVLLSEKEKASIYRDVDQSTRLKNRVIDLRTTANQAIFSIQSAVVTFFRNFLVERNFVEIHTPKIISAASEGGSEVFKVDYFGRDAYLAQSPQLYKQMLISSDFERVFEIAPVFRAENSNSHRHMTEFTGMDIEMQINQSYHEVLQILDGAMISIFKGIEKHCTRELEAIQRQYPFRPFKYLEKTLILEYPEIIKILREANFTIGDMDDINSAMEKALGNIIYEKYGTDFYIIDKFPAAIRPFYSMPDPEREGYVNAYDIFMRGEEICSGAQRIHEPQLLTMNASEKGVDPKSIESYINSFLIGCPPHAGGGIGLERVTMFYLGLNNIRKTSLFPRDPYHLEP